MTTTEHAAEAERLLRKHAALTVPRDIAGIDRLVALAARDDLLWIAAQWDSLRARLRPGGGNALTGVAVATSNDGHAPIDVHISDLMYEIEENVARFYGRILADETDWTPATSAMPALLRDVATRYGHFTAGDDDAMALGFCDDANDYRHRVTRALERPAPPTYVGPCQQDNCHGELYVQEKHTGGRCPECGHDFTLVDQRAFLDREMDARLMTLAEIPRALNILGVKVPAGTVRRWAAKPKDPKKDPLLKPAVDGDEDVRLYRLADAKVLAESGRRGKVAA